MKFFIKNFFCKFDENFIFYAIWAVHWSLFLLPKELTILNKYIKQRRNSSKDDKKIYFVHLKKVNTPCAFHVLLLYFSCTVYNEKRGMENNQYDALTWNSWY